MNWKQSLEQQQSVTSALQHLQQPLTPFTETGWMTEGISNKCWDTIKEMASSYQLTGLESEEEEEDSAMAALMRSTGEEIEENFRLLEMS